MSSECIFVGRRDELTRFDEILARAQGQAVVVGQPGMDKTMLLNYGRHAWRGVWQVETTYEAL